MPGPLAALRGAAGEAQGFGGGRGEPAAVEQRNEVPALAAHGIKGLHHGDGLGLELDGGAQLPLGGGADTVLGGLLIANDAAGDVPAGAVELVVAPGEQSPAPLVLNQKIHVHQRRELADQQEEVLGQARRGFRGPGFQGG